MKYVVIGGVVVLLGGIYYLAWQESVKNNMIAARAAIKETADILLTGESAAIATSAYDRRYVDDALRKVNENRALMGLSPLRNPFEPTVRP